jgi:DNA-binding GntR family transcriptional regulator
MKSEKGVNLSEPVYKHLVDMILSLQLKPGEKIPETKIAEQFGISRTPIREALRKLANDGLIRIQPNCYAEVASFDETYIRHIGELRIAIEQMVIKLAVLYGSNADYKRLLKYADEYCRSTKEDDQTAQIKIDMEFHLELARISQNQLFEEIQRGLNLKIEFILACKNINLEDTKSIMKAHYKLVDALFARDEKTAIKVGVQHLVDSYSLNNNYEVDFFLKF